MIVHFRALLLATVGVTAACLGCRAPGQPQSAASAPLPRVISSVGDVPSAVDPSSPYVVCQYRPPASESVEQIVDGLSGPQPVETYVAYALGENPDIAAARQAAAAASWRVPQARSLEDPMLGIDTQMPPTMPKFAIGVSQKFPWLGKLAARGDVAAWGTSVAQAQLAAVELSVVEEVKRAYYELHFVEQAILITTTNRDALVQLVIPAVDARVRAGASQQDLLRTELEGMELDNELVRLRQELATARARLTRLLSVAPTTPVGTLVELPGEQTPQDVELLYQQAIAARPELRAALASVRREQRAVDVAALEYLPDTTLRFSWMDMPQPAMPNDPFMLGVMVNLPIYRGRLAAGVREAQASVATEARRYDSLRDRTIEQVTDLFAQVESQRELVRLFREDIVPKADQTFQVSSLAYQAGAVDFLQFIDNWRQLLRFQLALERQESQLRQTLAALERTVGGYAVWQAAEEATLPDPARSARSPLVEPLRLPD